MQQRVFTSILIGMVKTILVVGINGFVGKHLTRDLSDSNYKVYGTGLDPSASPEIQSLVNNYTQCDLTVAEEVEKIPLHEVDAVINLAALATPGQSFNQAELYNKVNVLTHTNVLDRLKAINKRIRVLAISTGAVYDSAQPMPLTETSRLTKTGSPYVASKLLLEEKLDPYRESGYEVVVARPLNHTGPGQGSGFIVPDLTKRILAGGTLIVGPINTSRDYTHVADVVRAYRLLVTNPKPLRHTVYNICSGVATSRDELIGIIEKVVGRKKLPTQIDQSLGRPNDPVVLYGSHDRITQETGWKPTKNLEDIINDYVIWLKAQPDT